MYKLLPVAIITFAASISFAETNIIERAERQPTGGRLLAPRKNTKHVYYVNAQSRVSDELVAQSCKSFSDALRVPLDITTGHFSFPHPKIEGELSLYVIDDENLPISLIAPEECWAFVNVAPLAKGRGEKRQFLEARVRKELARVASILFGGIGSTNPGNILSSIKSADDLDVFPNDKLPADALNRCFGFLRLLGVRQYHYVSYRRACQEGWAPAPTNDIQKAIWDEVHKVPEKPIKITYDKDKQKPVVK